MSLTDKQEAFCLEYLIDLNATQAAIRAGYSTESAGAIGGENLQKPEIQKRISELQADRMKRNKIDADRVLKEIERIAFYDLAAHIPEGKITGPDDLKKLPEDLRRAIIGWRWDKAGNFIVLWADKVKGLELYGRHLKLFTDKVEATGANGTPINPTPPTPVVISDPAVAAQAYRDLVKGG